MTTPVAIITGASAGIGTALARVFAKNGHALVLVARRENRLKALAAEIAASGAPMPLVAPIDIAQPDAVPHIEKMLAARDFEPQYVVNNAGFGLVGRAASLDQAEQLAMIDLNVRALTDFSLAFVDSLTRHRGGLLNVGSVGGFLPGPNSTVYYASKAYVLSFGEALYRELKPQGVRVTTLCPGPVETEFQTRAGVPNSGRTPVLTLPAERVAEEGYRGLMAGKRLVIPGMPNKIAAFLPRVAPRGVVLALMAARQRRRKAKSSAPTT
ncbi:MAG: SDR family oxidoreductase [Pseudomonadota bacterium]